MRKGTIGALLAAGFLLAGTGVAHAQSQGGRSAASTWNDSWAPPSENQQAIDLAIAEAQLRARNDGYGPGYSTTNYNGTVNSYVTHNGPETTVSSGSTNIGQSNSTTTTMKGSGLSLTVSTGQTMGDIRQGADSRVTAGSITSTSIAQRSDDK